MTPDHRTRLQEDAYLTPQPTICGRQLRRFGPASFVLLRRLGNRLVTGGVSTITNDAGNEVIDFSDTDNLQAILEFIYVHSAPVREVLANSRNREDIEAAVLESLCDIDTAALGAAAAHITAVLRQANASIAEVPDTGNPPHEEDPDPNAQGPRG